MYPSLVPSTLATIFKLKFPFGWKTSFSPVPLTVPMVPLLSVTVDILPKNNTQSDCTASYLLGVYVGTQHVVYWSNLNHIIWSKVLSERSDSPPLIHLMVMITHLNVTIYHISPHTHLSTTPSLHLSIYHISPLVPPHLPPGHTGILCHQFDLEPRILYKRSPYFYMKDVGSQMCDRAAYCWIVGTPYPWYTF